MKYDDASWHSEGDFPPDLPPENGATHIGMFFAWAVGQGLVGELHLEDSTEELQLLGDRVITPGTFFLRCCDGKLTTEDFSDEGDAFARHYFASEGGGYGPYLDDYDLTLSADLPTMYHVKDSWENFDRLKPVIQQRFQEWKSNRE